MMTTTQIAKVHCNRRITLMSNMHNDVFAAFIEADKALKELPAIREELARTVNNLDGATHRIGELSDALINREHELEALRSQLASREAELARATFRADAVEA